MAWIPDWDRMITKKLTLHFRDKFGELYEIETMLVSVEKNDTYRLLEQPIFDEDFTWGDLIEGKLLDDQNLEIIKILEHCEHINNRSILGLPSATSAKNQTAPKLPSLHNSSGLKKIMADGGFWQQDMGGLLIIFYPPGKKPSDYH